MKVLAAWVPLGSKSSLFWKNSTMTTKCDTYIKRLIRDSIPKVNRSRLLTLTGLIPLKYYLADAFLNAITIIQEDSSTYAYLLVINFWTILCITSRNSHKTLLDKVVPLFNSNEKIIKTTMRKKKQFKSCT